MDSRYELYPLGEQAVVIRWEGSIDGAMQQLVTRTMARLKSRPMPAVQELVRTYRTVTVYYDPVALYREESMRVNGTSGARLNNENKDTLRSPYEIMCEWIHSCLQDAALWQEENEAADERMVRKATVPVCFGGRYGPDLAFVAARAGMTEEEAIALYCSAVYVVHMIGFVPGFPYLGGLPQRLSTPRLSEPRMTVPAGSVGIAGQQTGIYPQAIPGGWQLIGQTPLRLFAAERHPPALLQAGDQVIFQPIAEAEFEKLREEETQR